MPGEIQDFLVVELFEDLLSFGLPDEQLVVSTSTC